LRTVLRDQSVGELEVELFRRPIHRYPLRDLRVPFVLVVKKRGNYLGVAVDPTTILGRACTRASNAAGRDQLIGRNLLDDDLMNPAVAEVVHVLELVLLADEALECVLLLGFDLTAPPICIRRSELDAANIERVQVAVVPTHRILEHTMEAFEVEILTERGPAAIPVAWSEQG